MRRRFGTGTTGVDWLARQILSVTTAQQRERMRAATRFNPHPAGQTWPGSATEAVLDALQRQPFRLFQRGELVTATGRTEPSVDWAIAYLIARGRITVFEDARNPRYRRYRLGAATTTTDQGAAHAAAPGAPK